MIDSPGASGTDSGAESLVVRSTTSSLVFRPRPWRAVDSITAARKRPSLEMANSRMLSSEVSKGTRTSRS